LKNISTSIVLYESPFKIMSTLELIKYVFSSDVEISVSREITKKFEETVRGNIGNVIERLRNSNLKGEFAIVLNNNKD